MGLKQKGKNSLQEDSVLVGELIDKVKNGDQEAFRELMATYKQKIYGFCWRMLGDADIAEDAAQETFIKVFFKINQLRENEKFEYWLYKIAKRWCLDEIQRRQGIQPIDDDISLVSQENSQEVKAMEDERNKKIKNILKRESGKLDPKYREILILIHYEEKKYREAAKILKININTAKIRFHRAIEKLSKALKPYKDQIDEL